MSDQIQPLQVGLGDRTYPIYIGAHILADMPRFLARASFPQKLALVTNTTVDPLYTATVKKPLERAGYSVVTICIEDGELYKSLQTLESIFDAMIKGGIDRGCGLLALGGGVVGDIAGFAAASYMRGIPFVQVPTTLLAQVDSSVGGKTAVNHPLGKNLIGAFYQPQCVVIDTDTLATLERRDLAAGMAEVIKYGVIRDREFFNFLKEHVSDVFGLKSTVLAQIIKKSCQIKADIVENDETEQGVRALLNFGHTYGHAVETLSGYGAYRHGEAVAIGMKVAASISAAQGLSTKSEAQEIIDLIASYQLPVVSPSFDIDEVIEAIMRDKKVTAGTLKMVLNQGIGDARIQQVTAPASTLAPHLP